MQELHIIVHSDKIKIDNWAWKDKLNNALTNATNFEIIHNYIESIAMGRYTFFSHTFRVKDTFTVEVSGDIDLELETCNVIFECDSLCEELADEFAKAFEEYFETKICCKLQKDEGVAYLHIYDA